MSITDYNGKASVDEFNLTNYLTFQINGYFNLTTKLSVTKKSFIIQLDPKVQNLDGVILSVARSMSKKK